jgi:hypothetical protein
MPRFLLDHQKVGEPPYDDDDDDDDDGDAIVFHFSPWLDTKWMLFQSMEPCLSTSDANQQKQPKLL